MAPDKYIEDKENKVKIDAVIDGKTGELDFNTLKSGGVIKQRQKDLFTVRLRCPGGRVPLDRLEKIAQVAKKYGGDYVHISVRQSIEITYVNFHDFAALKKDLDAIGQEIASCGPRVRVPTACSGCEYNPNGVTDTQKMAKMVNDTFFGRELNHKFKISFSGCPIDCARTTEMDMGFQGAVKPVWTEDICTGCRLCSFTCLEGAIEADAETGHPIYKKEKCLYCGDCIRTCPTDAWAGEISGWMVRVGGKHGRHPVVGRKIAEFVSDEKLAPIIDRTLEWYKKAGKGKGRKRICTLLLQDSAWEDFISFMKPVLGENAVLSPLPPTPVEIHFEKK
ncbi:MAG: 4Fe-4S dicluster domain-containing protein [Candidatus Schekmanbacteria bacterium]|nr:4Fe-4S dicluster domain-containing protein [Candidatus Schekmanbacteria bacterium]